MHLARSHATALSLLLCATLTTLLGCPDRDTAPPDDLVDDPGRTIGPDCDPAATRPWQHVLDVVGGYLIYVEALARGGEGLPRALNFGPDNGGAVPVARIAEAMLGALDRPTRWEAAAERPFAEPHQLSLDSGQAHGALGWRARLRGDDVLAWTAAWYRAHDRGEPMRDFSVGQLEAYGRLE